MATLYLHNYLAMRCVGCQRSVHSILQTSICNSTAMHGFDDLCCWKWSLTRDKNHNHVNHNHVSVSNWIEVTGWGLELWYSGKYLKLTIRIASLIFRLVLGTYQFQWISIQEKWSILVNLNYRRTKILAGLFKISG